jgi:hypothetical protein
LIHPVFDLLGSVLNESLKAITESVNCPHCVESSA